MPGFIEVDGVYHFWYIVGQQMADGDKVLVVVFFRTENGREPVREWLVGFGRDDMRAIGTDLKTVEFGWPVGMPTCRALGDGLWETWHGSGVRCGHACGGCGATEGLLQIYGNWGHSYPNGNSWEDAEVLCPACGAFTVISDFTEG